MTAAIFFLPQTPKGRAMLRLCAKNAFERGGPPWVAVDGTEIYSTDFDTLAAWIAERADADYRDFCKWRARTERVEEEG